jgi:hypothetical protein
VWKARRLCKEGQTIRARRAGYGSRATAVSERKRYEAGIKYQEKYANKPVARVF